jgi:acetoin utilization protein AcuC
MADPPSASTAMPPVPRDPRDPRVLTISLHEHPVTLWPGTGLPAEASGPVARHRAAGRGERAGAVGSAVDVALSAATTDAGWLRAFHALAPAPLREFHRAARGCEIHR